MGFRQRLPKIFAAMTVANLLLIWLLANQPSGASGPDSYAIGLGAFLFYGLAILLGIAALLFWAIAWRPFRIALVAASAVTMAFLLVNVIDPWWW